VYGRRDIPAVRLPLSCQPAELVAAAERISPGAACFHISQYLGSAAMTSVNQNTLTSLKWGLFEPQVVSACGA
jgi:hypothetical protein